MPVLTDGGRTFVQVVGVESPHLCRGSLSLRMQRRAVPMLVKSSMQHRYFGQVAYGRKKDAVYVLCTRVYMGWMLGGRRGVWLIFFYAVSVE